MTPDPAEPAAPPWNKLAMFPVVAACLVVAGSALVGAATASGDHPGDGRFVGLSTGLSLVLAAAMLPAARRFAGSRAGYILALSLAAQAMLPLFGALYALSDPFIVSHWRCGTGDAALVLVAPVVALVTSLVAALATRVGVPRIGGRLARALTASSRVVLVVAGVVTALGVVWAARRPTATDYLARMPLVAVVPAVPVGDTSPHEGVVAGTRVWRQCTEDTCALRLGAPNLTRESGDGDVMHVGRGPLRVRLDARADLVVFEGELGYGSRAAFRRGTGVPVEVSWHTLAREVSPPWTWCACALVGLGLALATLRRKSALTSWRGAREATLTEHGNVVFGDGGLVARLVGEVEVAPGSVLVRDDAPAAHLRDMAIVRAASLRAGTLRALRDATDVDDGGRYAFAAAVAAWSALPLGLAVCVIAARA